MYRIIEQGLNQFFNLKNQNFALDYNVGFQTGFSKYV
jgi:hypothetical protein